MCVCACPSTTIGPIDLEKNYIFRMMTSSEKNQLAAEQKKAGRKSH
jgi:hypothetical protein